MTFLRAIVLSLFAVRSLADNDPDEGFSPYDNDFIEPNYILGKHWNATTVVAQESIVQWADWLAAQAPWCTYTRFYFFLFLSNDFYCVLLSPEPAVTTSKPFLAPSNDTHDYLSWAP
jgi:hypothetical protein